MSRATQARPGQRSRRLSCRGGAGAGSVARQIMGTAVIGGMVVDTFIGRFFIPAFFYVMEKLSGAGKERAPAALPQRSAPAEGD